MSRHRAVRNINLDDEMADDDDEYMEGGDGADPYDGISEEEHQQLEAALAQLVSVIGQPGSQQAGFTEREMKDALWDAYFDVDEALGVLVEERSRREAREKRRAETAAKKQAKATSAAKPPSGASTPATQRSQNVRAHSKLEEPHVSQLRQDIEGLGLTKNRGPGSIAASEGGSSVRGGSVPGTPRIASSVGGGGMSQDRIISEYRTASESQGARKRLNLVVVGHVDAGKSTLMGRLLNLLGSLSDRDQASNERASAKMGKGSFAYAWALDSSEEERARGVTIDVAQDHFSTAHRQFTLLDAPGHRDFIPNMISGATQADAAVLVVDSITGAFEAGFGQNGQTREHALLIRSLGVQQLVVVVNKLDAVDYSEVRYRAIEDAVRPFLASSGFDTSKVTFVPCGAVVGENLAQREASGKLSSWYTGPTLIDVLDMLEPPSRSIDAAFRMPITNVFRAGQTAISSGLGVSGRIVAGVTSVGERVIAVPGDEVGTIKAIEYEGESVPWAVAGASVTLFLSGIEQVFVTVGAVVCPPSSPVPTAASIVAQVLVFEPTLPILAGSTLDMHHHSSSLSVTLTELVATLDLKTGQPLRQRPRVLSRGVTAKVHISLPNPIPIDTFARNRDLGRILLRQNGETVAAGIVLELL